MRVKPENERTLHILNFESTHIYISNQSGRIFLKRRHKNEKKFTEKNRKLCKSTNKMQFPNLSQLPEKLTDKAVDVTKQGLDESFDIARNAKYMLSTTLGRLGLASNFLAIALIVHYIVIVCVAWTGPNMAKYGIHLWGMGHLFLGIATLVVNFNVGKIGANRWSVIRRSSNIVLGAAAICAFLFAVLFIVKWGMDVTACNGPIRSFTFTYQPVNISAHVGVISPDLCPLGVIDNIFLTEIIFTTFAAALDLGVVVLCLLIWSWAPAWNAAVAREEIVTEAKDRVMGVTTFASLDDGEGGLESAEGWIRNNEHGFNKNAIADLKSNDGFRAQMQRHTGSAKYGKGRKITKP